VKDGGYTMGAGPKKEPGAKAELYEVVTVGCLREDHGRLRVYG
jgi:hypothetical protein